MQIISDMEAITQVLKHGYADELESRSSSIDQPPLAETLGDSYAGEGDDGESFDASLLRALANMAVRSKRRQADLSAALHRAGLRREPADIPTSLRALELAGFIENIVPLYDGGLLMSVTSRGIEQLHSQPRWSLPD